MPVLDLPTLRIPDSIDELLESWGEDAPPRLTLLHKDSKSITCAISSEGEYVIPGRPLDQAVLFSVQNGGLDFECFGSLVLTKRQIGSRYYFTARDLGSCMGDPYIVPFSFFSDTLPSHVLDDDLSARLYDALQDESTLLEKWHSELVSQGLFRYVVTQFFGV